MSMVNGFLPTAMDIRLVGKIAKALSDPNRLRILNEVRNKHDQLYCIEICDFVDLTQPSICHHVKILTDIGLLESSKEGRNIKYSLNHQLLDEYTAYLQELTL